MRASDPTGALLRVCGHAPLTPAPQTCCCPCRKPIATPAAPTCTQRRAWCAETRCCSSTTPSSGEWCHAATSIRLFQQDSPVCLPAVPACCGILLDGARKRNLTQHGSPFPAAAYAFFPCLFRSYDLHNVSFCTAQARVAQHNSLSGAACMWHCSTRRSQRHGKCTMMTNCLLAVHVCAEQGLQARCQLPIQPQPL